MMQPRPRAFFVLGGLAAAGVAAVLLFAQPTKHASAIAQEKAKEPASSSRAGAPESVGQKAKEQPTNDGEQALRKAGGEYVDAMNRGDLQALMAHWAPDADYIDEAGKQTRGRDAIQALVAKSLPALKGTKVSGKVQSVKFLRPEVAMEDGSLEFTAPDGTKISNRYAVVWTKTGDKWLISSARDLPGDVGDVPSPAYTQLKSFEWLMGEWQDQSDKVDISVHFHWAPNKSFFLADYTVKTPNAEPTQVCMRIGWDPHNGIIRSWVFDSTGGFGEGYWERNGNKWIVAASGVLPDGGVGGATHVYEYVDQNTFIWRSHDREVDGQPLADSEVKFVRKTSKKPEESKP